MAGARAGLGSFSLTIAKSWVKRMLELFPTSLQNVTVSVTPDATHLLRH